MMDMNSLATRTDLNNGYDPRDHDYQVGKPPVVAEAARYDPKGGVGEHAASAHLNKASVEFS
jgi:hypothetical protein